MRDRCLKWVIRASFECTRRCSLSEYLRISAARAGQRNPGPGKARQLVGIRAGRSSSGQSHIITRSLAMTPTITAFKRSPDGGKGLARDMRVRWALEEVGQPYEVRLVSFGAMKESAHRALHPFGQVPTYEEGDLALFETGAIVFYIAQCHAGLLPDDANARARAITWMFAALSTLEPPIVDREIAMLLERDETWHDRRLPLVKDRVRGPLNQLSV